MRKLKGVVFAFSCVCFDTHLRHKANIVHFSQLQSFDDGHFVCKIFVAVTNFDSQNWEKSHRIFTRLLTFVRVRIFFEKHIS